MPSLRVTQQLTNAMLRVSSTARPIGSWHWPIVALPARSISLFAAEPISTVEPNVTRTMTSPARPMVYATSLLPRKSMSARSPGTKRGLAGVGVGIAS
jgi:hypothetical protein